MRLIIVFIITALGSADLPDSSNRHLHGEEVLPSSILDNTSPTEQLHEVQPKPTEDEPAISSGRVLSSSSSDSLSKALLDNSASFLHPFSKLHYGPDIKTTNVNDPTSDSSTLVDKPTVPIFSEDSSIEMLSPVQPDSLPNESLQLDQTTVAGESVEENNMPKVHPGDIGEVYKAPSTAAGGGGAAGDLGKVQKRTPTLIPNIDDFELGPGFASQKSTQESEEVDPGEQDMHLSEPVKGLEFGSLQGAEGGDSSLTDRDGTLPDISSQSSARSSNPSNVLASPHIPPLTDKDKVLDSSTIGVEALDSNLDDERRINLASADDGAAIIASNKEAKYAGRAIDEDADSYVKNLCSAAKWLLIELSQLGRVDMIELSNKEMYSSRVRDFSVKGRQTHPKRDGQGGDYSLGFNSSAWQLIGNFTAANLKGTQSFLSPKSSRLRVRYLLVQFLTHYGNEEVCALNQLKVLGVSAAQELEAALARQMEESSDIRQTEPFTAASPPSEEPPQPSAAPLIGKGDGPAVSGSDILAPEHNLVMVNGDSAPCGTTAAQCSNLGAAITSTHPLSRLLPMALLSTLGMQVSEASAQPNCTITPCSPSGSPNSSPFITQGGDITTPPLTSSDSVDSVLSLVATEEQRRLNDFPPSEMLKEQTAIVEQLDLSVDSVGDDKALIMREEGTKPAIPIMLEEATTTGVANKILAEAGSIEDHSILRPTDKGVIQTAEPLLGDEPLLKPKNEETAFWKGVIDDQNETANLHLVTNQSQDHQAPLVAINSSDQSTVASPELQQPGQPKSSKEPATSSPDQGSPITSVIALPPCLSDTITSKRVDRKGVPAVTGFLSGTSNRPRSAGNLFDIFKQEFVLLKLNQTRMSRYMTQVVSLINRNAGDMSHEVQLMEDRVHALEAEVEIARREVKSAHDEVRAAEQRWARLFAGLGEDLREEIATLKGDLNTSRDQIRALSILLLCIVFVSAASAIMRWIFFSGEGRHRIGLSQGSAPESVSESHSSKALVSGPPQANLKPNHISISLKSALSSTRTQISEQKSAATLVNSRGQGSGSIAHWQGKGKQTSQKMYPVVTATAFKAQVKARRGIIKADSFLVQAMLLLTCFVSILVYKNIYQY